ncbi:MAG: uroporphyrinogen-III synthase [Aquabacterium sp.]
MAPVSGETAGLCVLVTRPQPQADEWVQALRARRCDAVALPLLRRVAAQGGAAVAQAWAGLCSAAPPSLAMFVSPGAVSAFMAARPAATGWPAGVRAAATGPGTSAALRGAGLPPEMIVEPDAQAGQYDAEALWRQLAVEDWRGRAVLLVRGEGGRDWLSAQWRAAGATVMPVDAYRREAPAWSAAEQAQAAQAVREPARHLWLFSSSQAVAQLPGLMPGAGWGQAHSLATHPRIAEAARAAGFGQVAECRPLVDEVARWVAAAAGSLQSSAP